jgi:hypothetical protein
MPIPAFALEDKPVASSLETKLFATHNGVDVSGAILCNVHADSIPQHPPPSACAQAICDVVQAEMIVEVNVKNCIASAMHSDCSAHFEPNPQHCPP